MSINLNDPDVMVDAADSKVWVSREKSLEQELAARTEERDFLREVIRLLLVSNTGREPTDG